MKIYRRKAPTRLIFAIVLILSSFLSAYFLSVAANRSQTFWAARSILSPGMVISSSDLVEQRAALYTYNGLYLPANRHFEKFTVVTKVGAGELLPRSAISADIDNLQSSAVPISVLASDFPANAMTGEMINLYQVGDPRLIGSIVAPALILRSVSILGIDKRGENLGANISLTLSVKRIDVLKVINATSSGRLVVVRVYG